MHAVLPDLKPNHSVLGFCPKSHDLCICPCFWTESAKVECAVHQVAEVARNISSGMRGCNERRGAPGTPAIIAESSSGTSMCLVAVVMARPALLGAANESAGRWWRRYCAPRSNRLGASGKGMRLSAVILTLPTLFSTVTESADFHALPMFHPHHEDGRVALHTSMRSVATVITAGRTVGWWAFTLSCPGSRDQIGADQIGANLAANSSRPGPQPHGQ